MTGYDKVRKGYKWEVLALLWVAYLLKRSPINPPIGTSTA